MSTSHQFLASVPRGFADLLRGELAQFGALDLRERGNAVAFTGSLETAYRACLESRLASRIYLELARFEAASDAAIYAALRTIDWPAHVDPRGTLACEWSGRHPAIANTHFGTLRLKDAICDALREACGLRPDIAMEQPAVRVHAHANGTRVTVSIDLAGEGLHRRGWRSDGGAAPLRENVAAGLLLRAGWPALAQRGAAFLDPMCGSGTLVIEAARIAADIAANLERRYFGFLGWRGHDAATWQRVRTAARDRAAAAAARRDQSGPIIGRDRDPRALRMAQDNAARAQVADWCRFEVGELATAAPPTVDAVPPPSPAGLLCCNPPYGVRLGDVEQARAVHAELGAVLRQRFQGWQAAVLTGSPELGLELGLRAHRVHTVWNGAIEGRLLRIEVGAGAERDLRPRRESTIDPALAETPGARMFANRLAKNQKALDAWIRREAPGCYRLYDADMPEYAFAIDVYCGETPEERWLYVQEYQAPREIPEEAVRRRRSEALAALAASTGVPVERIHLRTRKRNNRGEQYAKLDEQRRFEVVNEQGLRFLVNFTDYLDTGLFLDHRITRRRLREAAAGRRFLNLFAYTGTATVYAAAGGARSTTTVDLSHTYLDWAQRNLAQNGLAGAAHRFVQADVREWLHAAAARGERYDLVFCDPPTFSNSKRMEGVFDVQRDHVALLQAVLKLLAPGGLLVFSTNAQKFRLDPVLAGTASVRDISRVTLPPDFARNPRIHQCFEIRVGPDNS
ncbi:MAG: bifunctional 23S rRNA (guanine(2069)-N(7))-methyltransferase RlmK/23S rRNA (guanine(2445)-N(2))-methyltransferase RlmL [Sinobacteraceae bacterium]|nr:bifunctional 23S rRNA (guanine(2069)-N(7))-methyltransferase RlmK/23S rRNA (guanine(2445)-N(2))-methyltransferase RlmL [Nevskiaceae bacterium]